MRCALLSMIVLIGWAGGLAGCHDPRAEAPTQRRLGNISRNLNSLRDREIDGNRRLAVMSARIRQDVTWRNEQFGRDLQRTQEWFDDDVQRWQERQPLYRQHIEDELDGDLKRAYDTIPRLIY